MRILLLFSLSLVHTHTDTQTHTHTHTHWQTHTHTHTHRQTYRPRVNLVSLVRLSRVILTWLNAADGAVLFSFFSSNDLTKRCRWRPSSKTSSQGPRAAQCVSRCCVVPLFFSIFIFCEIWIFFPRLKMVLSTLYLLHLILFCSFSFFCCKGKAQRPSATSSSSFAARLSTLPGLNRSTYKYL